MAIRTGKISVGTIALTSTVALVATVIVVWMFGGVTGEEFSPQKFMMRRFHYWQIPWLRVQIWPVSLSKIGGPEDELAQHIRRYRLMGDVSRLPVRWDIMTMDEVGLSTYRGDASILTNYLRQPGAVGLESLLDWTKNHSNAGGELWSIVAKLAHADLYPAIPAVLEAARRLDADEDFGAELRKLAAQECRQFASAEQLAGDLDRSARLLALAGEIISAPPVSVPSIEETEENDRVEAETDQFSELP